MLRIASLVYLSAFLNAGWLGAQGLPDLHSRSGAAPTAAAGAAEPSDPPARTVKDGVSQVTFHLPAGWNLARRDGELSTFRLDARSAPRSAQIRAVANIAFNPYPRSTFSGALFYLSVTSHSTASDCLAQANGKPNMPLAPVPVGDVSFARGHDAHGNICTEARDAVYTALRHGSCVRFDLAINSFCGGEVSGAQDLTEGQLENIQHRLEGILESVHFGH